MTAPVPRSNAVCSRRSKRIRCGFPCWSADAAWAARSCSGASASGWESGCQYIDVERLATTPERLLRTVVEASPFSAPDVDVERPLAALGVRLARRVLPGRAQPLGRAGRRSCWTKRSSSGRSRTSPACAMCSAI